jgi:DNA-binding LacI/PurR family transcriptional regulator
VPEEVAVVGIDDIEDGRYSTPTLTTIRPDKEHIAQLAVQLLVDRLKDRHGTAPSPPRELTASFDLIVRESSGSKVPGVNRRASAI